MNGKLALTCTGRHQIKPHKVESVDEIQIEKGKCDIMENIALSS